MADQEEYEKTDPKEHYQWPLRKVVKVVRKGREHTDVLSCGHTMVWRGSSSWKEGESEVTRAPKTRRCRECFAEEKRKIDDAFSRSGRERRGSQQPAGPPTNDSDGD